ncbi:MAG: prephenate dehydrogenase [Lachnospiraceae bacterium]|nr:prephenate dehydrogenase [Lachnospiraceae bacterium]MBQ3979993.1 prephenate dehydrogenase [Lachnospiraceae bacterium]MCR5376584.1 prephenate dehydrogenase [Lachnospiraceae bacterium]
MLLDKNTRICIVGLGLLGGSYAAALSRQGYRVTGIARRQESVDYAVAHGMIERGSAYVDEALLADADLIVFSLYPHVFIDWIHEHGSKLRPGTVITDVTGVKGCVVYEIQKSLPKGVEFIAAHPMAGRESSGIEYSDDRIFRGANYIVVPTEANSERAINLCKALGETLGCKDISVLDVASHDRMIAFLSQLTHCIAVSLMCACDAPDLERYTGDSFRDLTRIANINDEMWSELFLANKDALLREMDAYRAAFDELRETIASGDRDRMREMMRLSTKRRKRFDKKV